MIKLLTKRETIERELCQTTRIFGEEYGVQIIYTKINNPELDLVEKTINIYLPNKYKRMKNTAILKLALEKMYDEIARVEIENVMEETRVMLKGLAPENYEIKRIPNRLAKCSSDKNIVINPDIIKYDKQVLRYVILHEFCHLKYKSHAKGFFKMMEQYMPNYEHYDYILNVA
ncbi:MAG: M48 family metallopeptidase [Clostridia bacterium]|nr:M48 family metallopeptidase [Clostridia bacterium]